MDFESLTSNLALDKVTCANCWNYLSYFPIYVSPDGKNICGRCPKQKGLKRIEPYEALAQFVSFPCRYKDEGCFETLPPNDIPKHEAQCLHRTVNCPVKCEWQGSYSNLHEHCMTDHDDLLLTQGEFEVDLTGSNKHEHFLEYGGTLLLVTKRFSFSKNELECAIADLKGGKFSCEVSLKCGKKTFSVELEAASIFDEKSFTQISLHSIRDNNQSLFGKIIVDESAEDTTNLNYKDNMKLLSVIKCGDCKQYATPPIHQCSDESTVLCSECVEDHKSDYRLCTNQNVTLDKIASLLNYPCRYRKDGCSFVSKSDHILDHQDSCTYRECQCPLKYSTVKFCKWTGFEKDMMGHLQTDHQDKALGSREVTASLSKNEKKYSKIMAFASCLFKFHFWKISTSYAYKMRIIAGNIHQNEFMYEIEIIDQGRQGRKLLARQMLSPTHIHYIRKSQVKRMLRRDSVEFRVRVFKKI